MPLKLTGVGKSKNTMKPFSSRFVLCLGGAAFAFGFSPRIQAQDTLTNGLIAFYPFKGNANDASGNGNDGAFDRIRLEICGRQVWHAD